MNDKLAAEDLTSFTLEKEHESNIIALVYFLWQYCSTSPSSSSMAFLASSMVSFSPSEIPHFSNQSSTFEMGNYLLPMQYSWHKS
jgi:hypothetical protein